MNKLKRFWIGILCIFLLFSCSKSTPKKQPPPVPVIVASVLVKNLPVQITAIGNVEGLFFGYNQIKN